MHEHSLTPLEFQAVWGATLSDWVSSRIAERDMRFSMLGAQERDEAILKLIRAIEGDLVSAGPQRENDWNLGWAQNVALAQESGDLDSLVPHYFDKYHLVRWRGDLVQSVSPNLEYNMFSSLLDWVIDSRIDTDCRDVFEFGCGTGHNLLRLRQRFPHARLWGLDWVASSQVSVSIAARMTSDQKMHGLNFNYFLPDADIDVPDGSTFLTVASLEQIGTEFVPFINWVLKKRPKRVINIEPIGELLNENNLLDNLSLRYFARRNYLHGFLDYLAALEDDNQVAIIESSRTHVGSFLVDGYSLIVWEPL